MASPGGSGSDTAWLGRRGGDWLEPRIPFGKGSFGAGTILPSKQHDVHFFDFGTVVSQPVLLGALGEVLCPCLFKTSERHFVAVRPQVVLITSTLKSAVLPCFHHGPVACGGRLVGELTRDEGGIRVF